MGLKSRYTNGLNSLKSWYIQPNITVDQFNHHKYGLLNVSSLSTSKENISCKKLFTFGNGNDVLGDLTNQCDLNWKF